MTLYKPSLFINRLIVWKGGARVFDLTFQLGVNIIRGQNSSGKSTIADLIFYALGGEVTKFKPEAADCDYAMVEVSINDSPLVVKREITNKPRTPMQIFWGPIDKALAASNDDWQLYPFQRSDSKESFSQVLFRALGMPEVKTESAANLTMHQLLRLIYADQISPTDNIFRAEQFDSSYHRQAIGDLLTGVYNDDLYQSQNLLVQRQREFDSIQEQLKSIYQILGSTEQDVSLETIEKELEALRAERDSLAQKITNADKARPVKDISAKSDLGAEKKLRDQISMMKADLSDCEDQIQRLRLEVEDSRMFIEALQAKLSALKDAIETRKIVGDLAFHFCPACLAPIQPQQSKEKCQLCHCDLTPIESSQALRMQQEIELQIKESQQLLGEKQTNYEGWNRKRPTLILEIERLTTEYNRVAKNLVIERDDQLEKLNERLGFVIARIENLDKYAKLAAAVNDLSKKKQSIQAEVSSLNDKIARIKALQESQRAKAMRLVASYIERFLKADLPREQIFQKPENVLVDFAKGTVSINERNQFSASSMVYLKNSFHVALFAASLDDGSFRYPRFLLLDNVEDKGMEDERSHNFQLQLVELSKEKAGVAHQIIFTTAKIAPELEQSGLTRGDHYTEQSKTLKV